MSFLRNDGMNNKWQQPIEPNVPPDIEQQGEGPQNPQSTPDWNAIVGAAVAAQTSHLHQEMEQMRSLMGVGQNTRSENSSLSRLSKRTQSDLSEESEDSCENCAKWRHKYGKVYADANSMFCNLQSARHKVDLLEREAEVLRCKLKRAQNISPPQPGNPRLEITHPPQVQGKSDGSRPSEAHPQVGTSASGSGRPTHSLPYGQVTIPPGPIAWQATEGQEPPTGQAIPFGSLNTMMPSAKLDKCKVG